MGIRRSYDENGIIVEEVNYDEGYKFTIEQLVDKMLNEYNVDLMTIDERKTYFTRVREDTTYRLTIPCYKDGYELQRQFIIDGITGKTIKDNVGWFVEG